MLLDDLHQHPPDDRVVGRGRPAGTRAAGARCARAARRARRRSRGRRAAGGRRSAATMPDLVPLDVRAHVAQRRARPSRRRPGSARGSRPRRRRRSRRCGPRAPRRSARDRSRRSRRPRRGPGRRPRTRAAQRSDSTMWSTSGFSSPTRTAAIDRAGGRAAAQRQDHDVAARAHQRHRRDQRHADPGRRHALQRLVVVGREDAPAGHSRRRGRRSARRWSPRTCRRPR